MRKSPKTSDRYPKPFGYSGQKTSASYTPLLTHSFWQNLKLHQMKIILLLVIVIALKTSYNRNIFPGKNFLYKNFPHLKIGKILMQKNLTRKIYSILYSVPCKNYYSLLISLYWSNSEKAFWRCQTCWFSLLIEILGCLNNFRGVYNMKIFRVYVFLLLQCYFISLSSYFT